MSSLLRRAVTVTLPRLTGMLLLVATGAFALRFAGGGLTPAGQVRPDDDPNVPVAPGPNVASNVVKQGFPAARSDPAEPAKSDSAWEIEWELSHPENRPWGAPGSVLR